MDSGPYGTMDGADQPEVWLHVAVSMWSVVRVWLGISGSLGAMGGLGEGVLVIVSLEASRLGRSEAGLLVVGAGVPLGTRSVSVSAMGMFVPALCRASAVVVVGGVADMVTVVWDGWVSRTLYCKCGPAVEDTISLLGQLRVEGA